MKLARLLVLSLIVLASATAFAQSYPQVVAQVSLLNHRSTIPKTVIFTPVTTGIYRVSGYTTPIGAPNGSVWEVSIGWIDESGLTLHAVNWMSCPGFAFFGQNTEIIHAIAGTPVTYYVGKLKTPNFGYDLFITVEQLESD